MDIQLYLRVLWRFRVLVAIGLVLVIALTVLSVARVSFSNGVKLTYRQQQQYTSTTTVWVTQAGFPLGRSVYDKFLNTDSGSTNVGIPVYSDPLRWSGLTTLYASLVTSDDVKKIMERSGPIDGSVGATQPTVPGNAQALLPYIVISGTAHTPGGAVRLADRARGALETYVRDQQAENAIPPDKRVLLQVLNNAQPAVLTAKRSRTRPVVVVFAGLMVVFGLAFLLENLRPRVRRVESAELPAPARRTA